MLNVFCLWTGNKYPIEYVEKLKNMVSRNLTLSHQFICLTDKPHSFKIEGVKFEQANYPIADSWCKLSLFHPNLKYTGKSIYFDLDVVIVDSLDGLVQFNKDFTIIKDWVRPTYNSSVMIWEAGKHNYLATEFRQQHMIEHRGDQDLITKLLKERQTEVYTFNPKHIRSYKFSGADKNLKEGNKIVVFHGSPKPHEVDDKWVKDNWR